MLVLILGLVLFFGVHSISMNRPLRANLIARVGAQPFKGLFSVGSILGFVLIIYGFGDYRADGMIQIWDPPRFLHHVTFTLVLLAFIMLAATYAPMSYLKQGLKHPMLAAVKTWALGHLLSNGDLGGMILFGAFLAYGVIDRISVKRRAADPDAPAPKPPRIIGDIIAVGAGSFAYLAMMMLHRRLIGVSVMP